MLNPITTGLPKSCRCLRGFSESGYERRAKGCRLDGSLPSPCEAVFTATVTSTSGAPPDGETVTFKRGTTVLGTGTLSGGLRELFGLNAHRGHEIDYGGLRGRFELREKHLKGNLTDHWQSHEHNFANLIA